MKFFLHLFCLLSAIWTHAQTNDSLSVFFKKDSVMMPMSDGVKLNTYTYSPVISKDMKTAFNIPLPGLGQSDSLIVLQKGSMIFYYPNQSDSLQTPVVFLRTPYGAHNVEASAFIFPLLGYTMVAQDLRGRYKSEGTFAPFINDSWKKKPYGLRRWPLDLTPDSAMLNTSDGADAIRYILDSLTIDNNFNNIQDFKICNGKIGMYGGSAVGYSQYQAAAAEPVIPANNGLKCLMPIVATLEFQQSTLAPNGLYRKALNERWLKGVMNETDTTGIPDNSLYNSIHSLQDYGVSTFQELLDTVYKTYTFNSYYPYSPYRAYSDGSQAPVDANGNSNANGNYSRYRNMNVPTYHLTGWWDIFIDGQINTFEYMRYHTVEYAKQRQKLVIGPWTHTTIGLDEVGDQKGVNRYPASVFNIIGQVNDMENITSSDNFVAILNSELVSWYRSHLGEPQVVFPANDWQNWSSTSSYKVKMPGINYLLSYADFVNYLLGINGLNNFPIILWDTTTTQIDTIYANLPPNDASIFGDTCSTPYVPRNINWTDSVAPVRLYVVGPTNDPNNPSAGNYWLSSEYFPQASTKQHWYFHNNNSIDTVLPNYTKDSLTYITDPNNPVITFGGGNMTILTPDTNKNAGQIDLSTWSNLTMSRSDVLNFTSPVLNDTLSIIGYLRFKLYASLTPVASNYPDSANGDFVVRLIDVYPDGREMYITEGVVNARARNYAASVAQNNENINAPWNNVKSSAIYEYFFRSYPIAYTFGAGHQIKVLISSSNYPRYQSNPNIPLKNNDFILFSPGENLTYDFYGYTLTPQANTVNFYTGNNYPSFIELPVYNGSNLTAINNTLTETTTVNAVVYPNPAGNSCTVSCNNKITHISIFDISGKQVFNRHINYRKQITIPLTRLYKGIYFIQIRTGNQQIVKKITKM